MLTRTRLAAAAVSMLAAIAVAGCRRADASADAPVKQDGSGATRTAGGAAEPAATPALRLVATPDGNAVRYRVREQLVGLDMPNDAVGATSEVTGGIAFDSAGQVVPSASRFDASVGTLESDRDRRDGYVRRRLLETERFPLVVLAPTAVRGITYPFPASGTKTFQVLGDLTVKGVTRPTTWKVDARFDRGRVTGTATTAFTFADFGIVQPRVPVVLSVADTIRLEYSFSLVPES